MTDLEICNWALLKLGQCPIEALAEKGIKAEYSRFLLSPIHRSLLRCYNWNFATRTDSLSSPYVLPQGCLKVLKIDREGFLMGNCIISSGNAPLDIKYINQVDISDCDPLYHEALAFKLASELCSPLVSDEQLRVYLKSESDRVLDMAKSMDSIEMPVDRSY